MKTVKCFLTLAAIAALFLFSCKDDDYQEDQVFQDQNESTVLRGDTTLFFGYDYATTLNPYAESDGTNLLDATQQLLMDDALQAMDAVWDDTQIGEFMDYYGLPAWNRSMAYSIDGEDIIITPILSSDKPAITTLLYSKKNLNGEWSFYFQYYLGTPPWEFARSVNFFYNEVFNKGKEGYNPYISIQLVDFELEDDNIASPRAEEPGCWKIGTAYVDVCSCVWDPQPFTGLNNSGNDSETGEETVTNKTDAPCGGPCPVTFACVCETEIQSTQFWDPFCGGGGGTTGGSGSTGGPAPGGGGIGGGWGSNDGNTGGSGGDSGSEDWAGYSQSLKDVFSSAGFPADLFLPCELTDLVNKFGPKMEGTPKLWQDKMEALIDILADETGLDAATRDWYKSHYYNNQNTPPLSDIGQQLLQMLAQLYKNNPATGETQNEMGWDDLGGNNEGGSSGGNEQEPCTPVSSEMEGNILNAYDDFVQNNGGSGNEDLPSINEVLEMIENNPNASIFNEFLNEHPNDGAAIESIIAIVDLEESGHLNGPYDPAEKDQIIEDFYTSPEEAVQFATWAVILRSEWEKNNPGQTCGNLCWTKIGLEAMWKTKSGQIHTFLDLCGLVPGAGEGCDFANGILYTLEGDGVNATLSFAATIPLVGWYAAGHKVIKNAVKVGGNTLHFKNSVDAAGDIVFSHKGKLRKALGIQYDPAFDDFQAHHIIPEAFEKNEVIQKAAKSGKDNIFMMNHPNNGIPVHKDYHNGSHPNYSDQIRDVLNHYRDFGDFSIDNEELVAEKLKGFREYLKNLIVSNPNTPIKQLVINYTIQ